MYKISVTGFFAFVGVASIAMVAACSASVPGAPGEAVGSTAAEVSCEPITTCYNAGFACGTGSNGCGDVSNSRASTSANVLRAVSNAAGAAS
jgi:hypothetical protein